MAELPSPILYVCGFKDIAGGGQRSLLLLLKNLDRSRWRPILLLPGLGEISAQAALLGVEVRWTSYPPLKSWRFWCPLLFIGRLARLIRKAGIRIVHSDMPDLGLLAAAAARLAGARAVFHARTSERYRLDALIHRLHSAVIAVSWAAADRFADFGGGKVFRVANGVDLSLFAPGDRALAKAGLGLPSDALLIGYAGQLVREKGIETILRAFALVRREIPGSRLVIAGRGPDEAEMRSLAQNLGLDPQAIFVGFSQRPQEIMRAFDLLLFPSRFDEGLSRVLIEAMACGVAVIASANGSNSEVVSDGRDGFIIEEDHPELYAEKAVFLLKNDKIREEFAIRARKTAVNRFDARMTSQRLAAVYEGLEAGAPKSSWMALPYFLARRILLAAFSPFLGKRRAPRRTAIRRILVVRGDRLGDLILSLPFLRGLRCAYPQARITLLCHPAWVDLAVDAAAVDEVIPWSGFSTGLIARLRESHFDLAIDAARDNDLQTALVCRLSGAPFCVGFESRGRGLLLDRAVSVSGRRHFVEEMEELAGAVGAFVPPGIMPIRLSRDRLDAALSDLASHGIGPGDKVIFLHPGGHYKSQRWPAARFARAAAAVRRDFGCKVIASAGPAEASELGVLQASGAVDAVFPGLGIMDLAALIGLCGVFAGNNSGPLHLACALGVATVSTMGPTDAARWRPLGVRCTVLKASDFGSKDDVDLISQAAFAAALGEALQNAESVAERQVRCLKNGGG